LASPEIPVEKVAEDEVKTSWIRLLSLPRPVNPAFDRTGANCQVGQTSAGRWFLQSTIGGSVTRACTIPPNRQIICNVLSCELSDAELTGQSLSDQDLVNITREAIDRVDASTLNFRVDDGESSINKEDWERFKVLTEPSEIVLPANNLFQVQDGSTRFAAYGFYVKLPALARGPHTLYFGGQVPAPDGKPVFETAVNYDLTQL
jgi:hypothetical protein